MNNIIEEKSARICADKVSFRAGGVDILRDISLQIKEGEFIGLIGPNGSGKTTLLKNIYRVYRPDKGLIYLDGEDIHSMKGRTVAQRMAVLAQENDSRFDFTVIEIVMMGRYAHKSLLENNNDNDLDICHKVLSVVGMYAMKNRSYLSLSGGEKQRVMLAAAFAQEAEIIILDEPTNHLDIGYQLLIMDLIRVRKGITVFASIHDMNIAARYCDRLIAMNHGKIVKAGSPEEVLTAPLICELYHVNAKIERHAETGKLNICFLEAAPHGFNA